MSQGAVMAGEKHDSTGDHPSDAGSPSSTGDEETLTAATDAFGELGSGATTQPRRLLPRTIGRYRIVSVLGRGGMGVVYEAEQQHPRRPVALKVVRDGEHVDEYHIKLFQREVQTLARLKHPGIAAIYEAGRTDDGQHFFAMELVRGVPLMEYARSRRLSVRARLELFCKICDAINYAHQRGVIHRDVKPSNILIDAHGSPKILDFGLAKMTDSDVAVTTVVTEVGRIQGTLAYMSPEQTHGNPDEIDLRSDVYSLGVLLFELLTDSHPYHVHQVTLHEAVRVICEQAPLRPSTIRKTLRGDLETIVLKALEKDASRRYQSASALAEDVERYLTNQPILARAPSAVYQLRKFVARHKAGSAFVVVLFALVAGFGVWMRVLYQAEHEAKERAAREAHIANWVKEFMVALFKIADPNVARGKDVTARQLLEQGARRIAELGDEQPAIQAELMDTMATAYRHLGLYDRAIQLWKRALAIRRSEFGEQHVSVAKSLMHLGWALKTNGDYAAAEEYVRKALALHRRLLGPEDLLLADNLHLLGTTRRDRGDYVEAEQLMREALAIERKVIGDNHPSVANTLVDLAGVLQKLGDYATAEKLAREALAIRRNLPDEDHPHLASALELLVSILREKGNYAKAEALAREALAIRQESYEDDHPLVASSSIWLGALLRDQRHYAAAEPLLREALDSYLERLPPDHAFVASGMSNLGWLLLETRDYAGAETHFRQALEIYRARAGDERRSAGNAMLGLARVKLAQGDAEGAQELLREILTISRQAPSDRRWLTASAESVLGNCLAVLGRYGEAEPLALGSYEVMRGIRGPGDRYVLEALQRIVDLYEAWGKPEEAVAYRKLLHARQASSFADAPSEGDGS